MQLTVVVVLYYRYENKRVSVMTVKVTKRRSPSLYLITEDSPRSLLGDREPLFKFIVEQKVWAYSF